MPGTATSPGATFYTHISDQYAPFHTKLISATVRDATHVLDGLLYPKRERKERVEGKTAVSLPVLRRMIRPLSGDGALEVRDRAVLLFGFTTGLRRSEISRLDFAD